MDFRSYFYSSQMERVRACPSAVCRVANTLAKLKTIYVHIVADISEAVITVFYIPVAKQTPHILELSLSLITRTIYLIYSS